jgi:hypothetical protein
MTSYVNPYTGQTISPSQVSYESLSITGDTLLQWPINGNTTSVVANIIDVSASAAGFNLYMPSATEVSPGQSTLIRNTGAYSFTVVNAGGNTITPIASGVAQYIYVVNNTTDNGVWEAITFGTGTSAANAATLAGTGLTASGSTLNTTIAVVSISSAYTFLPADNATMYVWTGGAGTLTLPSASSLKAGWNVIIKNDGSGILNLALSGSNTIDGNSSAQLQLAESFVITCNGSNFFSYAYGRSATFFYTQLVKNVTGGTVTLTSAEAASTIQQYQGTLTSNCTIIVPSTVQQYSFQNNTTGSFTLTFKTSAVGGTTVVLPQGQTIIAICDGTNVYNSQTSTSSYIPALTVGNGSAAAPSMSFQNDTTTGFYLAATGQIGFTVGGANAATLKSSGLVVTVGISAGAF